MVEDVVGEMANDQSTWGLLGHGHISEFYLKWIGKSLEGFERGRALI